MKTKTEDENNDEEKQNWKVFTTLRTLLNTLSSLSNWVYRINVCACAYCEMRQWWSICANEANTVPIEKTFKWACSTRSNGHTMALLRELYQHQQALYAFLKRKRKKKVRNHYFCARFIIFFWILVSFLFLFHLSSRSFLRFSVRLRANTKLVSFFLFANWMTDVIKCVFIRFDWFN